MVELRNIGIVTWHYYKNFGSALQSYALQEAIKQLGIKDVEFVNYHNPRFGRPNKYKKAAKILLGLSLGRFWRKTMFGHQVFAYKYFNEGELTTDITELSKLSQKYDTIVCGSDQIWAPNCYNPVYFASFANSSVRKISYAASIGLNSIPDDLVFLYKEHLNSFYAVSVREEEGRKILKDKCNIESIVVLDPTFLHDAAFYKKIQRRVYGINGRYLFCYFLNQNHWYEKYAREYARKHNLQIIGFSACKQDGKWMQLLSNLGADHFVWMINNADAVMTDSYHGTIFSLLFHKRFWTFVRFAEDSPICQNSRIRQLQYYFGLQNHVVGNNDSLVEDISFDIDLFENKLKDLREKSTRFLIQSLS